MKTFIHAGTALLAAAAVVLAGCGGEQAKFTPPDTAAAQVVETLPDSADLHVLFLGNSLTSGFGQDLPLLVKAMADAGGVKLRYLTYAPGLTNLEDHWNDRRSRQTLARSRWDFVVMQQGPSTLPDGQADLKKWAVPWAEEIRKHKARPVLYMVQPTLGQRNGFKLVSQSYRGAATAAKAQIAPAGEAWEEALRADPGLELYQPNDNLHATEAGMYLSALVLTHELTGVKPSVIPDRFYLGPKHRLDLPHDIAATLRQAAEKVIARRQQPGDAATP